MAKTRKFAFVRLISSVLFGYNKSIKKITIPSSVRYIFGDAFRGCTGLADDRGFLIVNNTLYGYLGMASEVDIPDGVTRIETGVFDKASFQKVRIPESVTDISCYAFCDCNQLTDISMGGNIERIENGAFLRCVKLKSITIPDSIRHIGEGAFEDCESLSEIKISDIAIGNLKDSCIRKGLLNFTLLFKYLCGSFTAENEKMESLIITELNLKKNFTRMTDLLWTHKKCGALAKLFLSYKKITPENIDVLLEKCEGSEMTEMKAALLDVKNRLFTIEQEEKFYNAESEKELGLKERTLADWRKIFSVNTNFPAAEITKYKGSDETVEVPGSIEKYSCISIGVKAFYRCETVKAVYLGEGVKTLCYRAFYGCNNLKEIHIPGSVDTICDEAIGKKVKIFAPVGSAAEKYAKEKGNKFTAE